MFSAFFRKIFRVHLHQWRNTHQKASAYFRKENWPHDYAFVFEGHLEECSCGSTRIRTPHGRVGEIDLSEVRHFKHPVRGGLDGLGLMMCFGYG